MACSFFQNWNFDDRISILIGVIKLSAEILQLYISFWGNMPLFVAHEVIIIMTCNETGAGILSQLWVSRLRADHQAFMYMHHFDWPPRKMMRMPFVSRFSWHGSNVNLQEKSERKTELNTRRDSSYGPGINRGWKGEGEICFLVAVGQQTLTNILFSWKEWKGERGRGGGGGGLRDWKTEKVRVIHFDSSIFRCLSTLSLSVCMCVCVRACVRACVCVCVCVCVQCSLAYDFAVLQWIAATFLSCKFS